MKTILLVDDDTQLRTMFAAILGRHGYHVLQAASGESGLALARQHLPDLILTDVHMPGGDGEALLRHMRQDPELKMKQVVLMTGRPETVPLRKAMEEGADDFLLKPVSMEALLNCVEARFRRAAISWRVEDEMVSRLRSSMPSQLPHELFTPLAGIVGLSEILCSNEGALSPLELADIHKDIHVSALRLNRTLRNYLLILDQRPLVAGAPSVPLSSQRMKETVKLGIAEVLQQNERAADIAIRVDERCSLRVRADDLQRIISELVDNACKYSRQGTPIEVRLSEGRRLIVTDRGRGMTPQDVLRIGAFQQFDRDKNEQQGLGLGLALVRKVATCYGAELNLDSRPGEGTTAEIVFKK